MKAKAAQKADNLAPIITQIRKAGAGSLSEIAKALTERGIPQPSGSMGEWSAVQVSRVLERIA
ncbi:recombinase family protein [Bradyrhizobium sp. CCGUVB23]|uniref:recombinase family protein n=1 Tax=Bradyrhizobium sp. CCGUVB23 TaxID=2949630 RepID=UPI0020B3660D|nr:recombinase family protein [Bradyrhizobium sp. CCGUVB23]MCP3460720.1 recombinase family protein [Bradyrhizobium sp. CCGUVB23]